METRQARRKSVTVSFSGDDDVVQHIIDGRDKLSEPGRLRSRRQSFPSHTVSKASGVYEDLVEDSSDEDETLTRKATVLGEDQTMLAGGEMFGFKTPKKSGQMAQRASESRTPKSILKAVAVKESTPKKSVNFNASKEDGERESGIPLAARRSQRSRKPASSTPYRLHKRYVTDSDSEDSLDASGSDSDNSEPKSAPSTPVSKTTPRSAASTQVTQKVTPGRKSQRKMEEVDMTGMVEEYFDIHSSAAGPTSDTTLSRLDVPRMDQQTLTTVLTSMPASHHQECQQLYEDNREMFTEWMYQMCNGFNVLLYGLGSKRNLMEDFRSTLLKDFSHLVINGYFPSLTVKHILNSITDEILGHVGSFKSPLDQCDFIRSELQKSDTDVYLIVHSIDGAMLRNEKAQNVLSILAQVPSIHFIASVDHINSSLVWDQAKSCRFNWLWYDATTYGSYQEETSYENSLMVQQSGSLVLSSLSHVMKSLTPNARGIFLLLTQHQLENKDNSLYIGLSLQDLYQRCREAFLVNSDMTLQAQLTEFRDHKMIRSKKSFDGVEYLYIPLEAATLAEFLGEQNSTT